MATHTESIPEFLIERLDALDEEPLEDVAAYAEDPRGRPPETVPDNVANSLYMQAEDVREAVAEYAKELAEGGGEPEEPEEEDGDDDQGDFMMGPSFG